MTSSGGSCQPGINDPQARTPVPQKPLWHIPRALTAVPAKLSQQAQDREEHEQLRQLEFARGIRCSARKRPPSGSPRQRWTGLLGAPALAVVRIQITVVVATLRPRLSAE